MGIEKQTRQILLHLSWKFWDNREGRYQTGAYTALWWRWPGKIFPPQWHLAETLRSRRGEPGEGGDWGEGARGFQKSRRQERNHLRNQKKSGNDQSTSLRGRVEGKEMGEVDGAGSKSSCKNLRFIGFPEEIHGNTSGRGWHEPFFTWKHSVCLR